MLIAKKEDFKSESERVRAYQSVFGSALGERVLWDIAKSCRLVGPTTPQDGNAILMAVNEGTRNAVLRILAVLDQNPSDMEARMKESDKEYDE